MKKRNSGFLKERRTWISQLCLVIAVLLLVGLISAIGTSVYYGSGEPARDEKLRRLVETTVALTEPGTESCGPLSSSVGGLFSVEMTGELCRQLGGEHVRTGSIDTEFTFEQMTWMDWQWRDKEPKGLPFMDAKDAEGYEWERLDKLPKGTVVEAYLVFDHPRSTASVLKKMKGKDFAPVWFAVDTGDEKIKEEERPWEPIGFPYGDSWLEPYQKVTSRKVETKGFFETVSESAVGPDLEPYGSAANREKYFMKSLRTLAEGESKLDPSWKSDLQLKRRIGYLEKNGIKLSGALITGLTKEVLKLKKEPWIAGASLGEVDFWNWYEEE
ncbi:anti-sigma factor [Salinithrix halophila]|uniref:Anti sigma factor C-terminal domain-containing protein n=1 Tax=Salinithrix halophila TaxID=1485204 RepID=A0ABV8JD85_9BACL